MAQLSARAIAGSAMAVAGGALMVIGGFASHSFLLSILTLIDANVGSYLSGTPLYAVELSILAISILIGLGGLTVIAGGALIFMRHSTAGRLLIMLGGGAGFLGLLVSFGYTMFSTGLANALDHSVYWLGLILAVVARRISK